MTRLVEGQAETGKSRTSGQVAGRDGGTETSRYGRRRRTLTRLAEEQEAADLDSSGKRTGSWRF